MELEELEMKLRPLRRRLPSWNPIGRLVLPSLALLLLTTTNGVSSQKKTFAGPRMEIEPELHDFGSASQNQKLIHDFTLHNVGSEDLVIRRISTSCGCTAALASEQVIPPGETATLKVTLETRKYRGQIQRSISLASNDSRRVQTVRVQVFVEPSSGY